MPLPRQTADPGAVTLPARCLLVDGHALLYRAFFALPVMTTRDGRHTHALLGFIRMLNQLLRCWRPTHAAVVFDAGLPARRLDLLENYKAQRPAMPAELREQIDYLKDYLEASAVAGASINGEEADDVMASLATQMTRTADAEILIASSDKDLYQLVSERIALVSPAGKPMRTGAEEVRARTGVAPEQAVAWLALIGDGADNIPGVPGIGPKTAARLLREYGDLANLWRNLAMIKPVAVQGALQKHRECVERNVKLISLQCNLPVPENPWRLFKLRPPDAAALSAVSSRYELKSLAPEKKPPPPEQGELIF